MKCCNMDMYISLFIDDALDEKESSIFNEHISQCKDCRHKLEEYRRSVDLVKMLPKHDVPDGFFDRLQERILEEEQNNESKNSLIKRVLKGTAVVAAAIVLFLSVKLFYQGNIIGMGKKDAGKSEIAALEDSRADRSVDDKVREDNESNMHIEKAEDGDRAPMEAAKDDMKETTNIKGAAAYIKSDSVILKVQDVCVTPQALEKMAIMNDMEIIEILDDGIKIKITDEGQRKVLAGELTRLGNIEDIGTDYNSNTIKITIVSD